MREEAKLKKAKSFEKKPRKGGTPETVNKKTNKTKEEVQTPKTV